MQSELHKGDPVYDIFMTVGITVDHLWIRQKLNIRLKGETKDKDTILFQL